MDNLILDRLNEGLCPICKKPFKGMTLAEVSVVKVEGLQIDICAHHDKRVKKENSIQNVV